MKPKSSPISLRDIYIVASNVIAVPTPDHFEGEINMFSFEIDFDLYQRKEDESSFRIIVSIDGNDQENPVPGYCFNIIAEAVIEIDNGPGLKPEDKDSLLSKSAIPIVIGHIRTYLMTITAHGPYDKYILPVVDFNDLLSQKAEMLKKL